MNRLKAYLVDSGERAVMLHRLAHWLSRRGIRGLPALLRSHCLRSTGADISPQAVIGPGFVLPHPVGVVIGSGARVGTNVYVFSGVVIGQRETDCWPTIEDGARIYSGAKVLGNVTIGEASQIGANAVVLTDVPPGSTAVGIPARVIARVGARQACES